MRDALLRALVARLLAAPAPLLRRIAGPPARIDGQELDLQTRALVRVIHRLGLADIDRQPAAEARRSTARTAHILDLPPAPLASVEDRRLATPAGGLPCRLYRPVAAPGLPALVYYHGGGWVIGSPDTHDGFCRALARGAGCAVISVDYRLAPEHPAPAALEDAVAAFRAVVAGSAAPGIDPTRVAVGGDSAGGNLAALVALAQRDARRVEPDAPVPAFQLLIYPGTDLSREAPSFDLFADGFLLTRAHVRWFKRHYLAGADPADPRLSPLLAPDLRDLPPAHVVTAGFDVLRDEGQAYARRLVEAGVPVSYTCEQSLVHGFINLAGALPAARDAVDSLIARVRAGLPAPAVIAR